MKGIDLYLFRVKGRAANRRAANVFMYMAVKNRRKK